VVDEYLPYFEDMIVARNANSTWRSSVQARALQRPSWRTRFSTPWRWRGPSTKPVLCLGVLADRWGSAPAHRALEARHGRPGAPYFLTEYHKRGQSDSPSGTAAINSPSTAGPGDNSFQLVVEHIRKAIETKTDLEISYLGGKATTWRRVTPWMIRGMSLRGYCHLRKQERDFRLDRILECHDAIENPQAR
jgi:hypothetical protein